MKEIGVDELLESLGDKLSPEFKLQLSQEADELKDLEELYPYGLMSGDGLGKPVFIFKDANDESSLAIRLGDLQASLVALGLGPQIGSSVFGFAKKLLKLAEIDFEKVVFDSVKEKMVMAKLYFEKAGERAVIHASAEELLAICLEMKLDFYATEEVLLKSKSLELESVSERELGNDFDSESKNHKYLM